VSNTNIYRYRYINVVGVPRSRIRSQGPRNRRLCQQAADIETHSSRRFRLHRSIPHSFLTFLFSLFITPHKHRQYFSQFSLNCKILSLCSRRQLSRIFQFLTALRINRWSFLPVSRLIWSVICQSNQPDRKRAQDVARQFGRFNPLHATLDISRL
jgi:hypothetical protein